MGFDNETERAARHHRDITKALLANPYDARQYLARVDFYQYFGFWELAVGDAYKALLLTDDAQDESSEYHARALAPLARGREHHVFGESAICRGAFEGPRDFAILATRQLALSLERTGCPRAAYTAALRGLRQHPDDAVLQAQLRRIRADAGLPSGAAPLPEILAALAGRPLLPARLYPWNEHEPDRFSYASLKRLNDAVVKVAPKLRVRATQLPVLGATAGPSTAERAVVRQLGLFTAYDIRPGEKLLQEHSLLSAHLSTDEPSACDACGSELGSGAGTNGTPSTTATPGAQGPEYFPCPDCEDVVFCSQRCLKGARDSYHRITCGKEIESLARQAPAREGPDILYVLLLARAITLAEARGAHVLDLDETKFLWGDFASARTPPETLRPQGPSNEADCKLPWSFEYNVLHPIHVLQTLGLDIYATTARHDFWVLNTVYAKLRAVANARVDPRRGGPAASAVHPLWCLANHSCAPNVKWEWEGPIALWARKPEELAKWKGGGNGKPAGIKKDEEILNHYCDVELDVKDRREWLMGPLGGVCRCERCVWEQRMGA